MADGERTPEERERARWEREARRAAKRGEEPPPMPGAPAAPVAEPPRPAEPQHAVEAVAEPQRAAEPVAEPPAQRSAPSAGDAPGVEAEPPPPAQVATEAPPAEQPPPEPPLPPEPFERPPAASRPAVPQRGRRSASERRAAAREYLQARGGHGGPPRRGGHAHGAPDGGGRSSGPRRMRVAIVAAVGGLLAVAVAWLLLSLFQPLAGDGSGEVKVTIPQGAGVGEIGDILEREGVVASAFFFRARAALAGRSGDFKAGEIPMREDMSYGAAMDLLADPPQPETVTITIPEGLSRGEAKELIGDALRGDYMKATVRSPRLRPARYGGRGAKDLEGFLFPATYELKPGQPVRALVDRQLDAFERALRQVDLRHAKRKNLTAYDVVTIASMIDREAQLPRERRLVASVIYNRLSQGIPLGIDATIRFATGNWSEPLKQSELAIDSGYNTRTNQGLPPGPIGNPGLAALRAAANPARTDYIYYVVKPCGNGAHAFSSTDAQFQADVARYNAERERQGGKSPTDC